MYTFHYFMPHFQRMTKFFVALIKMSLEVSLPCLYSRLVFVPRRCTVLTVAAVLLCLSCSLPSCAGPWRQGGVASGLSQSACPDLCLACVDREAAWVPADPCL